MIEYINGDIFTIVDGWNKPVIIPHVVNNVNAWGSGVVAGMSKKWPVSMGANSPEFRFRNNKIHLGNNVLGNVQIIQPQNDICVANMYAQEGIFSNKNKKPIRYCALMRCMEYLRSVAKYQKAEFLCPKFGSDRAGGNWKFIEELIEEIWGDFKVTVVNYEK